MFERYNEPLAPWGKFISRLAFNIILGLSLVSIALGIGILGFHHFEKMGWIDAFTFSAMVLATVGSAKPLVTEAGKIFGGLYALCSGLAFISIIGVVFAPIFHRFLHRFYVGE